MKTTVTLNAEGSYGHERQYIARIVGRDHKFTYHREFVGRKAGRSTSATVDEPGLYELCDIDKKGRKESRFRIVVTAGEDLISLRAGADNADGAAPEAVALAIAKRLDAGESIADMIQLLPGELPGAETKYHLRTPSETKRADAAHTVDSAIENCWVILQALPEREAKKVMQALRLRMRPKEEAPAGEPDNPPAAPAEADQAPSSEPAE